MAKTRPPVFLLAIFFLLSSLALGQRAIIELPQEVETTFPNSSKNKIEENIGFHNQTDHGSISSKSDSSSGENQTQSITKFTTTSKNTVKEDFNKTTIELDQISEGKKNVKVTQEMDNSLNRTTGEAKVSTTATLEQNSTTTDPTLGNSTTTDPVLGNSTTTDPVLDNSTTTDPALGNSTTTDPALGSLNTELPIVNDSFPEFVSANGTFYLNDTDFDANETDVTEPSVEKVDQEAEEEVEETEEDLNSQPGMYLEDFCSCDLTSVICDIGCCCDPDCAPEDTLAFATCSNAPRTLTADPRYCSQRWTGLRNNTEYRLEETQAGLLCIQTDNRPHRNTFRPLKIVRTRQQYDELKEALPRQASSRDPAGTEPVRDPAHYRQGDKVWAITRQGNFVQLGLPSSLFGRECDTVRPLSYLNNARTSCTRRLDLCPPSSELGPRHYADFLVVTRPARALRLVPKADDSENNEYTTPETVEDSGKTTTTKLNPSTITPTPPVTGTYSEESTTAEPSIITYLNETFSDLAHNVSMSQNETNFPGNSSSDMPKILASLESLPNFALLKEKYFLLNSSYLAEVQIELCREVEEAVECQVTVDIDELPVNIVCGDVVSRVDYVITHNGTEGIESVLVKILLTSSDRRRSSPKMSYDDESLDPSSPSRCDCDSEELYDEDNFLEEDTPESFIKQIFSVEYRWLREASEDASESEVVQRSGRPGYIKGKPLLLGILVKNTTQEGQILEAISSDSDPMLGLTMLKSGAGGLCQERTPVTFGDNIRSVCSLLASEEEASRGCDQLRERILEELLGPVLGDEEVQLRVASYGDSSLVRPVEWVPLLRAKETLSESYDADFEPFSEEGRCTNLVFTIRLEVAYALQGSLVHPQAKVIGCLLTTGPPQLGPPTGCYGPLCKRATMEDLNGQYDIIEDDTSSSDSLNDTGLPDQGSKRKLVAVELTSTVVFIDMTQPSEPVFPDPPSLDLKLPYDFFYPYLPSKAVKLWPINTDSWLLSTCLVCCLHRIVAP